MGKWKKLKRANLENSVKAGDNSKIVTLILTQ